MNRIFLLSLVLVSSLTFAVPLSHAREASVSPCDPVATVKAVGSFQSTEGDGEHSYGHRTDLWQCGEIYFGTFIFWNGQPEGKGSLIEKLKFNAKNKEISFQSKGMEGGEGRFSGTLGPDKITGTLTWTGDNAIFYGTEGKEKLILKRTTEELKDYPNYGAWDKACHMGHCG